MSVLDRPVLSSRGARPEDGVKDMIIISDIDENGININLKTRYNQDQIYTFTGTILVAVNPYKQLSIYEQKDVADFSGKKLSSSEPHIFAISEAAYQSLCKDEGNQSCIISGESGAGKTESTKFILQYLCSVTDHVSFWVEQQILEANTVLEAFGNAKTVRNDNSSRFGKFMQVCFDDGNQIKGCIVQDYLLEQSRITFQSANERNYHVFYQLIAGAQAAPELQEQFHLLPLESYAYLNQSGCYTLQGVNNGEMFDKLRLAMNVLNIAPEMVEGIFSVLSAILLLGNMQFEDVEGEKSDFTESDKQILDLVCYLLGFEMEPLMKALLYRQIQVRGTITSIPFKIQEAIENRHAMAKALYSRTFAWLVDAINKCTNPGQFQTRFIGVLDIFGFENFQTNSFEQLCINYTNEKLHRFFNHYVFALEQESYIQEEIQFSHITFTDNTQCVELLEKPPRCILKILDEECRFPQGTDKSYLAKQHEAFETHEYYIKGDRRCWEVEFGILHYAGAVTYTVHGFLDKNKDTQQDQLFEMMYNSHSPFVQDLTRFQDLLGVRLEDLGGRQTISRTTRGKPTVGDTFKHQLSALVDILTTTNPWYVRCLKPNSKKQPNNYVMEEVLTQLKYSGMLDIIRIKREGYPIHVPMETFLEKYGCLLNQSAKEGDITTQVKHILTGLQLPITEWQVGKSKIFMRNSVFEPLEEKRYVFLNTIVTLLQKVWRGFHCRRDYLRKREATIIIQTGFRSFRHKLLFQRKKRAAIVLQKHVRGMAARRKAEVLREAKRIEEERLLQERLEAERLERERETANQEAIEDTLKASQAELDSLTKMISTMWNQFNPPVSPTNMNLDDMFSFLIEEQKELDYKSTEKALGQISDELQVLNELIDQDMDKKSSSKERDMEHMKQEDILNNLDEIVNGEDEPLPPPPPESQEIPPPPPVMNGHHDDNLYEELPIPPSARDLPPPPFASMETLSESPAPPPGPMSPRSQPPDFSIPPPPPLEDGMPPPQPCPGVPPPPHGMVPPPPPPPAPPMSLPLGQTTQPPSTLSIATTPSETETLSSYDENMADLMDTQNFLSQFERGIDTPPKKRPPILPPPPTIPAPPLPPEAVKGISRANKPPSIDLQYTRSRSKDDGGQNVDILSPATEKNLQNMLSGSPEEEQLKRRSGSSDVPPPPRITSRMNGHSIHITTQSQERSSLTDDAYYDMIEYANRHFNEHMKDVGGTLMKSLRKKRHSTEDLISKEEMLTFNKSGLIPLSHLQLHDVENIHMACTIFKDLTKYIKDEIKDDSALQVVQSIIKAGIDRIELRDEIFVQILRQTNETPEQSWLQQAWTLLVLASAAFSPSKGLHKYLLCYVKRKCSDSFVGKYALQCHKHLTQPRAMARKHPPSSAEIVSVQMMSPLICKVHFMDGKTKAVGIMPCDTMVEVLSSVAKKIGLRGVEGWALYEVTNEQERYIKAYEYIADVLAEWEQQERLSAQPSKYETLSKKGPKQALGGLDAKLVFRKRVYKHIHDIPNDPVEYRLLYAEAVNKVIKDEFPVSDKVALQLAGLQAAVLYGGYEEGKDSRYLDVDQYLPERIINLPGRDWCEEIAAAHRHYGRGVYKKTELEAQVWYLTCVKQFPLYGCTLFPINHKGMWAHISEALLAINMDGIKFVRAKDKHVINSFNFSDIETIAIDPNDNYITMELKSSADITCDQRCFMFETVHKEDIASLIESYSPSHASWLRSEYENQKRSKLTDEEKLKLYEHLVRCRRSLAESRLLHRPAHGANSGFLKQSIRRLTKSKMDRLRNSTLHGGQFDISYWSYTKLPLKQSLTIILEPGVEEMAVKMFGLILVFSGIEEAEKDVRPDYLGIVQRLMQKCLEHDVLCNEFYLQLVKQTTDHPDPNSQVNRRNWQLMAVLCSTISPGNSRVLKYVQCHLRKCSLDMTTDEGKFARYCCKCLGRTVDKKRRRFPPGRKEIQCLMDRRPIFEKVYFLNGEHRSIEFDAASTTNEVIKMVKAKIGMRSDAECFSLYEICAGSERNMYPEERLSDMLSKWERIATGSGIRDFRIIFKKRLFIEPYINPLDPVECDLVFHQLIEDMFEHKIPLTVQNAVQLCALKVQTEVNDIKSTDIDYSSVMRILPREMRTEVRVEDIAVAHKNMLQLSPNQAMVAFIDVLKASWCLFGATVFEVSQNYTSTLPKHMLLAVHQHGVHILEGFSFNVIVSFDYSEVVHSSPAMKSIMIIVGPVAKPHTKFMFATNQAFEIAHLIKDYIEELQSRLMIDQPQRMDSSIHVMNRMSGVFFDDSPSQVFQTLV